MNLSIKIIRCPCAKLFDRLKGFRKSNTPVADRLEADADLIINAKSIISLPN